MGDFWVQVEWFSLDLSFELRSGFDDLLYRESYTNNRHCCVKYLMYHLLGADFASFT